MIKSEPMLFCGDVVGGWCGDVLADGGRLGVCCVLCFNRKSRVERCARDGCGEINARAVGVVIDGGGGGRWCCCCLYCSLYAVVKRVQCSAWVNTSPWRGVVCRLVE